MSGSVYVNRSQEGVLKGGYDGKNETKSKKNNNVPLSLENSHNLKKFFPASNNGEKRASFSSSSPSPITSSGRWL